MRKELGKQMEYTKIKYSLDSRGIATLTLSDTSTLNSMDTTMFEEGVDCLRKIARDEAVRAVVITGDGRAFCAGGSLGEMEKGFGGGHGFYEHMMLANAFTVELAELPKPVIAKVNGAAVGAGMNAVLAADIAIASEKAKFSEIFGNIGLVPDVGGTYLLPRIVGRSKAKELILTYAMVDAQEALKLGIVSKVVSAEALDEEVDKLAERIAGGPTFAYAMGKKMINRSFETDIHTALEMEAMAQSLAGTSEDNKEGIAAFYEKRKAVFKGK